MKRRRSGSDTGPTIHQDWGMVLGVDMDHPLLEGICADQGPGDRWVTLQKRRYRRHQSRAGARVRDAAQTV